MITPGPAAALVVALGLVIAVAAQAREDAHRAPGAVELTVPSLAIPMDLASGRPVIELGIDGHGPYRFVLDTGAGGTVIDAGLARELSLAVVGRDSIGDPSNPGAFHVDVVRPGSITIGAPGAGGAAPLTLRGVSASTFEVRQMMGATTSGIIGLPDFADLLVTLDYPEGKVRFERGELAPEAPGVTGYESPDGIIAIPMTVGDTTLTAHLDSGNPGAFMLPHALAGRLHFSSPPVEVGQARTVNSTATIYGARLAGDIRAAGLTWSNPEVNLSDLIVNFGNIGFDALRDVAVTIDQNHHRLRFARSATAAAPAPQRRRLGIMFAGMTPGAAALPLVDGGLQLERVIPGGPAEKAGLQAGDVILAVNGRAAAGLAQAELFDILGAPRELQLRVKRGGQELAIVIP
jgi:hypothetical protein